MKYLNLLVFLVFCLELNAQIFPDLNALFSIEPKWTYVSEDTNWYRILENNPHIDQYFGRGFHNGLLNGDDYYLLEFSTGQTTNPPLEEGYFLHKIDINTGESKWVHYDNYFSGNEFVNTCFAGNMNLNEDGNININGFKSLDSLSLLTDDDHGYAYVNVMRHTIDDDNGALIEERVDPDTSRTIDKLHPGGFLIRRVGNNRQIKHIFENVFEDGLVRNYLHFYDIDEEGVVSDAPAFSYKHSTVIDFDAPFLTYPYIYYQLNEDLGVALFGSFEPGQGNDPAAIKLVFFDTSNSPDIIVTEERNILDFLPQSQETVTGLVTIIGSDNHFLVGQKVKLPSEDRFIWLQWHDKKGKPIQTIERLQVDGQYLDLILGTTYIDDKLYMLCFKYGEGLLEEDRYYLVMSDKNTPIKNLGSFVKMEEFEDYTVAFAGMKLLENKDLLLYMNINYPGPWEFLKANASFLCRFDGNDLGLTTGIVKQETVLNKPIYPNPAKDYINITDDFSEIENVNIFDVFGNTKPYIVQGQNRLDISDLTGGTYFLHYVMNGKLKVYPFVKI